MKLRNRIKDVTQQQNNDLYHQKKIQLQMVDTGFQIYYKI